MNRKKKIPSFQYRHIFSSLLFLAGSVLILWSAFNGDHTGLFWSNWYPLLIPESQVKDSLISDLKDMSDSPLVYSGNTCFFYNDFSGISRLGLEQQERGDGLLSSDPRLDPFIRGAGRYFKQDVYEIFYLPADRSPVQYSQALRQRGNTTWILPDVKRDIPLLIFAGLLSIFFILQAGRGLFPCFLMALHIGLAVVFRSQSILLPGMICLFLLSQYRKNGNFRYYLFILIPVVGLFALHFGMFTGVDCTILLFLFIFGLTMEPSMPKRKDPDKNLLISGKDHDLFTPVPLRSGEGETSVAVKAGKLSSATFFAVQAVLLVVLFLFIRTENRLLPVPIPMAQSFEGAAWSWEGIDRLSESGDIPGVREMLTHRAYQESLPYGGTWSFPEEGDSITLPVYAMEDGVVRTSLSVVQVFDQEWLDRFLLGMAEEGPGILLRSEAAPPAVTVSDEFPAVFSTGGLRAMGIMTILGILLSLLNTASLHHRGPEGYRIRNNLLIFRRKQQAA